MIKIKNYVPNTLRKDRTQAFQKDLQELYEAFDQIKTPPHLITLKEYYDVWEKCHMQFIFQCIGEEEDEDEFAQHFYQIVMKKYLLDRPKVEKIFTIFTLYCSYFVCERRKKILISKLYLQEIIDLMKANPTQARYDYMKLIRYLYEKCFIFCSKIGFRNPILKATGETVRKPCIISTNPLEFIMDLKEDFHNLKNDLIEYNFQKQEAKYLGIQTQKLKLADVYFSHRVDQLIKQFERDVEFTDQT